MKKLIEPCKGCDNLETFKIFTNTPTCNCDRKTEYQAIKQRDVEWKIVLNNILDILGGIEINPSNYDHEAVCELNSNCVEAYIYIENHLKEV